MPIILVKLLLVHSLFFAVIHALEIIKMKIRLFALIALKIIQLIIIIAI